LCKKLQDSIKLEMAKEVFFCTEKEHRALVVLRGGNFSEKIFEDGSSEKPERPIIVRLRVWFPKPDTTAVRRSGAFR